jgi:hypothetical protein
MTTAKAKALREIPFALIVNRFTLAGYWWGERWCGAVATRPEGGYQIRVLAGETRRGGNRTVNYAYFHCDADGTVTSAPRGSTRLYKPGRITGLDAALAEYSVAPDRTTT